MSHAIHFNTSLSFLSLLYLAWRVQSEINQSCPSCSGLYELGGSLDLPFPPLHMNPDPGQSQKGTCLELPLQYRYAHEHPPSSFQEGGTNWADHIHQDTSYRHRMSHFWYSHSTITFPYLFKLSLSIVRNPYELGWVWKVEIEVNCRPFLYSLQIPYEDPFLSSVFFSCSPSLFLLLTSSEPDQV